MDPAKSEFWTRTYLGAAMLLKGPTNVVFPCHQVKYPTRSNRFNSGNFGVSVPRGKPPSKLHYVCGGGRKSAVDLK
ncbi:hypothetical protein ACFX13_002074 [Malus domestica]